MIKKIGKVCISLAIAVCLSFATWYFLLIDIPEEYYVQGTAAPALSKNQAVRLMRYHGVKVVWAEGGEWFFRRDGKDCKLTK